MNTSINISHEQALKLETKLNVSEYSKQWIKLGDFLYNSRFNPELYKVDLLKFNVTIEQLEWINNNLEQDSNKKPYKLYI
tara:strand:+ start:282 stop:521 length:240 start_codon:yes stop_codon:yes gene_type:complete